MPEDSKMQTCATCALGGNGIISNQGPTCPLYCRVTGSFTVCNQWRAKASDAEDVPIPAPVVDRAATVKAEGNAVVTITLRGQIRGGKNQMGVTKTGIHFPRKPFKLWRDDAMKQIDGQYDGAPIAVPVKATIEYYAGDRKRRDIPAILDAIWHVLERAGVVLDDSLIKSVYLTGGYDKESPRAVIVLEVI